MGFPAPAALQLAPRNRPVPHAGRSIVRFGAPGTPFDQRAASRPQRNAGLCLAAPDDRGAMAESVGGGVVRLSPAARRIGCLGGGTQGCAQRLLRPPDAYLLCPLRPGRIQNAEGRRPNETGKRPGACQPIQFFILHSSFFLLSSLPLLLRPGAHVQGDAGDMAVRPVAAGLLAAQKNCVVRKAGCGTRSGGRRPGRGRALAEADWGENPVLRSGGGDQRRDLRGAAGRYARGRQLPTRRALRECPGFVLPLPGEAVLANRPGRVLSVPRALAARDGAGGGRAAAGDFGTGFRAEAAVALPVDGMAVVCRNPRAHDRAGASGRAGDGGSLHLHPDAGGAGRGGLGRARAFPSLARRCDGFGGGGFRGDHLLPDADAPTTQALAGQRDLVPTGGRRHQGQLRRP